MNDHIVKADDSKPFHTSGYAVVANGNRVGAVSTVTFAQRQQIEKNRQKIGGYNRSAIGRSFAEARARAVTSDASRASSTQGLANSAPISKPQSYDPYR